MAQIEERRGFLQRVIKTIGEVLTWLVRWIQPRRR